MKFITIFFLLFAFNAQAEVTLPAYCMEAGALTPKDCRDFLRQAVNEQKALKRERRQEAQLEKLAEEYKKATEPTARKASH